MRLITLASLAAFTLSMSVPAFAQMGTTSGSGSAMSGNSMSSDSSMPTTCQGMMDKANGMAEPTDASKKSMAMKQMDMAKMAMSKGQEKTCMMHMKMAMHDMM